MKYDPVPLGTICKRVLSGGTPKSTVSDYYDGGIPWLNTKEVHFNRIYRTERTISELGLNNSAAKWIAPHSVVVAMYGVTAGNVAVNLKPLTTNQACCNLEINEAKADYRYIYYYLKSQYRKLSSLANGGAQQNLNAQLIKSFEIFLPKLDVQREIADILWTLDDKIEQNSKINDNLLGQMQALYRSWFVDFLPFGGSKPRTWTETDIYSLANIIYGAPFKSKQFNTDGVGTPIIRIRDLKDQQFATYTTEIHPKGYLLQPGDIVVGMDGEFRPYIWGNDGAWLNQRVCVFENKRPNGKAFLYFTIKPLLYGIEQTQVATTVIHIGKKDFDAFEITLPDASTLDDFDALTTPMMRVIVSNCFENKRLAALRDILLPKLMSGEIDVSDIQL